MKQSENLIGAFPHGSSLKNDECGMMNDELKEVASGRWPDKTFNWPLTTGYWPLLHRSSFRIHHFLEG